MSIPVIRTSSVVEKKRAFSELLADLLHEYRITWGRGERFSSIDTVDQMQAFQIDPEIVPLDLYKSILRGDSPPTQYMVDAIVEVLIDLPTNKNTKNKLANIDSYVQKTKDAFDEADKSRPKSRSKPKPKLKKHKAARSVPAPRASIECDLKLADSGSKSNPKEFCFVLKISSKKVFQDRVVKLLFDLIENSSDRLLTTKKGANVLLKTALHITESLRGKFKITYDPVILTDELKAEIKTQILQASRSKRGPRGNTKSKESVQVVGPNRDR